MLITVALTLMSEAILNFMIQDEPVLSRIKKGNFFSKWDHVYSKKTAMKRVVLWQGSYVKYFYVTSFLTQKTVQD